MQGINNRKHKHLQVLLQQMEALLDCNKNDPSLLEEVRESLIKLNSQHETYLILLKTLAVQIKDYECHFEQIRVELIGKKLKKLRKNMKSDYVEYPLLKENIRLAYGT